MVNLKRFGMVPAVVGLLAAVAATATVAANAAPPASAPAAVSQPSFATPDEAVAALIDALTKHDRAALRVLLGPGGEGVADSGDAVADAEASRRFVEAFQAKHGLTPDGSDQMTLTVGPDDWPTPIPIVKSADRWRFDSHVGGQALIDRRIGRNEIAAIRVALAYVDAQKLYFDAMREQTGAGAYAERLVSTPGEHDGLYWPPEQGEPPSPLEPLVQQAEEEGYPGDLVHGRRAPYQGYYFRILRSQGPNAQGGAYDYVAGGHMSRGFALVAWPARYGVSGVVTVIVNQDGVVYQKDLGPRTDAIASTMKAFDPALDWARITTE